MSNMKSMSKRMLALFSNKRRVHSKDIHTQLEETIAERKKILVRWEKLFEPRPLKTKKDIHQEISETIAALKREKSFYMPGRKAA